MRHGLGCGLIVALALLSSFHIPADEAKPEPGPQEQVLLAAGLGTDGEALEDFFSERTKPEADLDELLKVARQLGDADPAKRSRAAAQLLARGPWADAALRQVALDQNNPLAAQEARRCLQWLEGKLAAALPIAAAKLLVQRKPSAAAAALLAYLPLADDRTVIDGVKAALDDLAARPGKVDAGLVAALGDPLPLRRAVAVEVLAASGRSEVLPECRKLLADRKTQVRLRAALALVRRLEEGAIDALIDLLAEAAPEECGQAEQALRQLGGELSPNLASGGDDALSRKIRREVWAAWWRTMDGPTLLAAFRQHTLNEEELAAARRLIVQLGDPTLAIRQRATFELIVLGAKAAGLLREAAKSADGERSRRAELCLKEIAQNDARDRLHLAAVRLLAIRNPAGAADALVAYVPFAADAMTEEIVASLKSLVLLTDKAEATVLAALGDPLPARRILAAEVFAGLGGGKYYSAVRKLLADADREVRLRATVALVYGRDKQAVPALIDLVAELPREQRTDVELLLQRLAGGHGPGIAGGGEEGAKKLHSAWKAWWKTHGAGVDLAALEKPTSFVGVTVIAELGPYGTTPVGPAPLDELPKQPGDPIGKLPGGPGGGGKGTKKSGTDRLIAVDRNGKVHWQIEHLSHPIDFQLLSGDRVLIAEFASMRLTERDLKGNILWQAALPNKPMNVQRLANGNTFIALSGNPAPTRGYMLVEIDQQGKKVGIVAGVGRGPDGSYPRGGFKLADGRMFSLDGGGICHWFEANGKIIKRFFVSPLSVGGAPNLVGNLDVTPKGHALIVHGNNTVAEYDADGKMVWKAGAAGNRASSVANGNTLVASEMTGVVELDIKGNVVWQYQPPNGYRTLRARQAVGASSLPRPVMAPRAGAPIAIRAIASKTNYVLDRQGMKPEKYREAIQAGRIAPPNIDLVVEITNTTTNSVEVNVSGPVPRLILDLHGQEGIEKRTSPRPQTEFAQIVLQPGQTYSMPLTQLAGYSKSNMADQLFWTVPGEYTLGIAFETSVRENTAALANPLSKVKVELDSPIKLSVALK